MEFLGLIGRGEELKAKEFFIRNTEDADALIDGMLEGADNIANAKDLDWTKVAQSIVEGLGAAGARILIPFLIGLI
jgi:hypothetical protein